MNSRDSWGLSMGSRRVAYEAGEGGFDLCWCYPESMQDRNVWWQGCTHLEVKMDAVVKRHLI